MVRVDGSTLTEPSGFSGPIDWNTDGNTTDTSLVQDINFNNNFFNSPSGSNVDSPFVGFNDWINVDLLQVGSRPNTFGFSSGGDLPPTDAGGGGDLPPTDAGGGGDLPPTDAGGGGDLPPTDAGGGGAEQDQAIACSTADPPRSLRAVLGSKSVVLNWLRPDGPCQVQTYIILRSTNGGPFELIHRNDRMNGAPSTTFTDTNVKNNTLYTYAVKDVNTQGATSVASNQFPIFVTF